MVIGLKYGRNRVEDREARDLTCHMIRQFLSALAERNGSINCTYLIGYDLAVPESDKAAKIKVLITKCPTLVRDAVELLEELL
jgi:hypothetical protein